MRSRHILWLLGIAVLFIAAIYLLWFSNVYSTEYISKLPQKFIPLPALDKADYDARMLALAHVAATTTVSTSSPPRLWPPKAAYPKAGAILPFKRIIAYYGNYYSRGMGVLGEYDPDLMLAMLASTTVEWRKADPTTPAVPAIHYIAVVAQAGAGRDGLYRLRMPDDQIDKSLELAARMNGLVFLDIQVGKSTLQAELPELERYLAMPQVHLGIDPEFSMKGGERPGTVIGTFDAADINYAAEYLAALVQKYDLPPKVLVIHRFTRDMMTNYTKIRPLPEVQIVVDMDGFGSKAKKRGTYSRVIYPEPVQFTGIKLFYKNDSRPPADGLLTPAEVLALTPSPVYIQYQ